MNIHYPDPVLEEEKTQSAHLQAVFLKEEPTDVLSFSEYSETVIFLTRSKIIYRPTADRKHSLSST